MAARRVLHVLEALEGGTARHVVDLTATVPDYEQIVAVTSQRYGCVTDDTAIPAMQAAGADVRLIDMRRNPAHPDNAKAFFAIRRLIARTRPDIVHTHASIGGALGRVAAAVSRGRPRVVWTPNGVMTAAPVVAVERELARLTDWTVAVSGSEAEVLHTLRLARDGRVSVVPNGIDITRPSDPPADLRAMIGLAPDVPLVGSVGRLVPQKAPLDFIEACRLIEAARPDVHFVYVGGGEQAEQFGQAIAAWNHAGRFHHLEYVRDVGHALGTLDVFLLMSRYEGAPYAPIEAMRESTAVVATDVVGTRDAVVDGETGLLVPVGDPAAGANAVLRLLDSTELRQSLVARALEKVRTEFDRKVMGQRVGAIYDDLLSGARGRRAT